MYIVYSNQVGNQATIDAIYNNPWPGLRDLQPNGLDYNGEIPQPEVIPNMDPYLRVNLDTRQLYHDYISRETFEVKAERLKKQQDAMAAAVEFLMDATMGGA